MMANVSSSSETGESIALAFPKAIFQDTSGQVWFSDNNAFYKFNYDSEELNRFSFDHLDSGVDFFRSFSFVELQNKRLIASSFDGIIFSYNPQNGEFEQIKTKGSIAEVYWILSLEDSQILIGGKEGVFSASMSRLNEKQEVVISEILKTESPVVSIIPVQESEYQYLVATRHGGISLINLNEDYEVETENKFVTPDSFNRHHLLRSSGNSLICSSDRGFEFINLFDLGVETFKYQGTTYQDISLSDVKSIQTFGNKTYSFNRGGIWELDHLKQNKGSQLLVKISDYKKDCNIFAGRVNESGFWIAGDWGTLLHISHQGRLIKEYQSFSGTSGVDLFHIFCDKLNRVWAIGGGFQKVLMIDEAGERQELDLSVFPQVFPHVINEAPDGTIVVGGRYSPTDQGKKLNSVENLIHTFSEKDQSCKSLNLSFSEKIENLEIHDMSFLNGSYNETILATSHRLFQTNSNLEVSKLSLDDDLSLTSLRGVMVDPQKENIWVSLEHEIIKLSPNPDQSDFTIDRHKIPLQNRTGQFSFRCIDLDSNGKLVAGTQAGLAFESFLSTIRPTRKPQFVMNDLIDKSSEAKQYFIRTLDNQGFSVDYISLEYPNYNHVYKYRINQDKWRKKRGNRIYINPGELPLGSNSIELMAK